MSPTISLSDRLNALGLQLPSLTVTSTASMVSMDMKLAALTLAVSAASGMELTTN
jgi:hypothetical protein